MKPSKQLRPKTQNWSIQEIELALNDATNNGSPSDVSFFLTARADYFFRNARIHDAEADSRHAIEVASTSGDDYILGKATGMHAVVLAHRAESSAEDYFLKAIELRDRSGNPIDMAWISVQFGNLLLNQGRVSEGLEQYELALSLYKEQGTSEQQAGAMIGIGNVYHNFGDQIRAIEFWKQAVELLGEGTHPALQFTALYNIGVAYVELKNGDMGVSYARKAQELSRKSNKPDEIAFCHNLFASIHYLHNEYEKALEEFRLSRSLYLGIEDLFNAAHARISIADCVISLGRVPEGIVELKIAEEELLSLHEKNALLKTYRALVDSYQLTGDYQSALLYYQKQAALQDEMFSLDFKTRVYLLERKFSEEKTEAETKLYLVRTQQLEDKLTMQTMAQAMQAEAVSKFQEELRHITRTTRDPTVAIKKINQRLKDLPPSNVDWVKFEKDFLAIHPQFRNKLEERFPALTNQELRLCQLLRTGLKSHEAARLMCITERGVEQHRLRVRRKLGIKGKESLTEFLTKI